VSFNKHSLVGEHDIYIVFGDTFRFEVLFDFDITGWGFIFKARSNKGAAPFLVFDESDMTVTAGDPVSVDNGLVLEVPGGDIDDEDDSGLEGTTAVWDFDCLQYDLKWVTPSGDTKTFIRGKIYGDG